MSWGKAKNAGAKTVKKLCVLCGDAPATKGVPKRYCRSCWEHLTS